MCLCTNWRVEQLSREKRSAKEGANSNIAVKWQAYVTASARWSTFLQMEIVEEIANVSEQHYFIVFAAKVLPKQHAHVYIFDSDKLLWRFKPSSQTCGKPANSSGESATTHVAHFFYLVNRQNEMSTVLRPAFARDHCQRHKVQHCLT